MPDDTLNILILAKDEASDVFKNIGGSAKKAFKTIGVAALAGGTAVAAGLGLAIFEAAKTEEIVNELNSVIESTGGIAGVTSREAQDLAKSFQSITKFSDEVIIRGETLLLTFTNIGEEVFPRATETMLNMGEAFGSVDGAAIQLGKALNDPVAGISALADVGVSFTQDQKDLVAAMMEVGDIAGAQAVILDELEKEFGGLAIAAGKGLAGQFTILKNKLQDIAVTIGNLALPAVTKLVSGIISGVEAIPGLVSEFKHLLDLTRTFGGEEGRFEILADSIGSRIPEGIIRAALAMEKFRDSVRNAFEYANAIIQDTIHVWGKEGLEAILRSLFKTWTGGLTHVGSLLLMLGVGAETAKKIGVAFNWVANALMDVLIPAFNLLKNTIIPFITDHLPAIRNAFLAIGAVLASAAIYAQILSIVAALTALTNPIIWIAAAIALLAIAWTEDWLGIKSAIVNDVWPALKPILNAIWGWLKVFLPDAAKAFKEDWDKNIVPAMEVVVTYWNDFLKPALAIMWGWFRVAIPKAVNFVVDVFNKLWDVWIVLVTYWTNFFKPALLIMWNYLNNFIPNAIDTLKEKWQELKDSALQTVTDFIIDSVVPALTDFRNLLTSIKTRATIIANSLKTKLVEGMTAVSDFLTTTAIPAFETFRDIMTAVKTRVVLIGNQLKTVFLLGLTEVTDYISGTAQNIWDLFKEGIGWIRSKLSAVATILSNAFLTAITTVTDFMTGTVQPAWDTLKTGISRVYNFIVSLGSQFSGAFKTALEIVQPLVDALASGFNLLKTALDPLKSLLDGVAESFKWITDNVPDWALPGSLPPLAQGFKDIGEQMAFASAKNTAFMKGMSSVRGLRNEIADISNFGENGARSRDRGTGRGPDLRNINYTLIVNSNASTEPIAQDFRFMQAWNRSI